jgi:hypothetical protein
MRLREAQGLAGEPQETIAEQVAIKGPLLLEETAHFAV